jgi:cytidine deaminase
MRETNIRITVEEYSNIDELKPDDKTLMQKAREASNSAYAPYSRFLVGAAVLLENGLIITGNNQENAAYPSGLCAERVALFAASATHPGVAVKAIAVTAKSEDFVINAPVTPCGSCRQVMSEYEMLSKAPMRILMMGETGEVHVVQGVSSVLPFMFDSSLLKRKSGQ